MYNVCMLRLFKSKLSHVWGVKVAVLHFFTTHIVTIII